MNSEIQDTIDLIKRNFNIQVNIKDQGDDCYTILNQYGDEEFTGNMTETLGFLYGVQYAAALPKPRLKTSREAIKEIAKISLGFFPIKDHIKLTLTLKKALSKLSDEDLNEIFNQLRNTINPGLIDYIRDLLYKRELEANKEYQSSTSPNTIKDKKKST